ncbi:MAG: FAD-dependent oxidoreductase, partial [Gammaproteobacteria bacterium]
MAKSHTHDVLVIGSGAAGLTLALQLADHASVAVICKGAATDGSTYYAQGGIAAVLDSHDSVDAHVADTLEAGAGLCHEPTVRHVVSHSREAIEWLVSLGVGFTRNDGSEEFHLTQEGGHSQRRIIHAADATGRAVSDTLLGKAMAHPNITLFEHRVAVDLIRDKSASVPVCVGAYVLDRQTDRIDTFLARHTVLASGGASKVYLYTSNPDGNTGDGIAMAWRAGCRVANLEFNQFHPT